MSVDALGVAAEVVLDFLDSKIFNHVSSISSLSRASNISDLVISTSNGMRLLGLGFEQIKICLLSKDSVSLVSMD
jgi:hypothetical protein